VCEGEGGACQQPQLAEVASLEGVGLSAAINHSCNMHKHAFKRCTQPRQQSGKAARPPRTHLVVAAANGDVWRNHGRPPLSVQRCQTPPAPTGSSGCADESVLGDRSFPSTHPPLHSSLTCCYRVPDQGPRPAAAVAAGAAWLLQNAAAERPSICTAAGGVCCLLSHWHCAGRLLPSNTSALLVLYQSRARLHAAAMGLL